MASEIIELSVRGLVEFMMRSGSIDSRFGGFDRAREGARIHKKLQKEAGPDYQAEVSFIETTDYKGFTFKVRGRADGIFTEDGKTVIDEIKTTGHSLEVVEENRKPAHFAQARCYAFFYAKAMGLDFITVQLTYYQVHTGEILKLREEWSRPELEVFYQGLLDGYIRWAEMQKNWLKRRNASIEALSFPYETYRRGQREMAVAVYHTICNEDRLFCQAPTGIGKTLSTLFPAVKAVAVKPVEKIFYLTAKTITRQAAESALSLMREKGLACRQVTLTAKDKICFLEERRCNPEDCPYAKDYYDRVRDVLFKILSEETVFTRARIQSLAEAEQLCPFELSLDLTDWCDVVIADYNYLFDPMVCLKRFFDETEDRYVFLVDEAHNLVDRSRKMYSAALFKSEFLKLKKMMTAADKPLLGPLKKVNQFMIRLRKDERAPGWIQEASLGELNELLAYFAFGCEAWQKIHPDDERLQAVLDLYFEVRRYLDIADFYDEHYRMQIRCYGSEVVVEQVCLDASLFLAHQMHHGRSSVLFSATLTPLDYFVSVLGGGERTPRLVLPSPFDPARLGILRADTVSTKYRDREASVAIVAEMIKAFTDARTGNYLIYFPSYAYMQAVYECFTESCPEVKTICQTSEMSESEREAFLEQFEDQSTRTLLAFCVMGGIYSEGIDLKGDRLIGTVIVGVGLPQLCDERNMIRDYYQKQGKNGYGYAYQYPGMNKVLQAIGRVIRDAEDRGMALLIDTRFSEPATRRLMPEHLSHFIQVRNPEEVRQAAQRFWAEFE